MSNKGTVPEHIAIIMDGNGRWAQMRGQQRVMGHVAGVESVKRIIRAAADHDVKYLTLYTFSTENWGRPSEEVEALMELFCKCVIDETEDLKKERTAIKIIGNRAGLSKKVNEHLEQIENNTAGGDKLTVLLAINYSARWEITEMARKVAREMAEGAINIDDIQEETVSSMLETANYPDPDLLIRSGGDKRLSNFLLWQCAYAELYFTDVLWPDFGKEELSKAIEEFAGRQRRFGLVTQ